MEGMEKEYREKACTDMIINMPTPFIIGVSGGRASGKSSVCKAIHEFLGQSNCSIISLNSTPCTQQDSFCEKSSLVDFNEIASVLNDIKNYGPKSYKLETEFFKGDVNPTKVILIEGNTIFNDKSLREVIDLKIFVHTDDDERLARKIWALASEKNTEISKVIEHHRKFEKPEFENLIAPTVKYADIIIPRGALNAPAMNVLKENLMVMVKSS